MLQIPHEDAEKIRTLCGPAVLEGFVRRAEETGWTDLSLRRPPWTVPGNSYTGAVLLAVDIAPPPWQLVVKVVPDGAPGREAEALADALAAVPEFSRRHLSGQAFAPLYLADGRSVLFQEIAGGSLRDAVPAGSLGGKDMTGVIEHVVSGLLTEWNGPALRQAVPEPVTVSDFLRRELGTVWTGGGSLHAFGRDLGVFAPSPPWLYSYGKAVPNPYLMVEGTSPALPDPTVRVLRGLGHGDLHLDNVLVPRNEKVPQADAYRLIDLCTFSRDADLARDAATLLLSALVPFVSHEPAPEQRRALLRFIVDPDATHRALIVPEAVARVEAVRAPARAAMQRWRDPWDVQFLLSLAAGSLLFTTYTGIGEAGRTWFACLAAHALGEVLTLTGEGGLKPPEPEPVRDSFGMTGLGKQGRTAYGAADGFEPGQAPRRRRWEWDAGVRDDRAVLGFGPNHTVVVVDSEGGVRRWSVTGDPLPGAEGRRSPRLGIGHQALVASLEHSVVVARPRELEIVHFPQGGGTVRSAPIPLPDEHFLVTSGGDVFATHDKRHLLVRDFESGAVIETYPCPSSLAASAVSIDASVIAMARSREVHIHRRGRQPLVRTVANSMPLLRSGFWQALTPAPGCQVAVSPSGGHVGCVSFEEVVVWSTDDGREVYRRRLTDRESREALGAKGMRLLCTETGTLFWLRRGRLSTPTVDGGTQLRQSGMHGDVAISPDGTLIAMLGSEGRLEIWDL
ncbi:hypothetical protein AB0N88_25980 [Streptomyces sp. NPDC093516]|uniref:hypothetical protein n=1 Tax=Streptomyces sp. NPDC093516 TaxID=3155304 RepID=UPI00342A33F2